MTVSFLVNLAVHVKETVSHLHAGTAEPFRIAPPEAAAYLMELFCGGGQANFVPLKPLIARLIQQFYRG